MTVSAGIQGPQFIVVNDLRGNERSFRTAQGRVRVQVTIGSDIPAGIHVPHEPSEGTALASTFLGHADPPTA